MSSGFISEAEIEERRKVRQAEWEKVRKPDEPLQAPEEEYDNRTLFERLEEQRQKKELEYEETHKLKNMIKGLDDDEIEFLDLVDRKKLEQEKLLQSEEAKELQQFRMKAAALKEQKKVEEEPNSKFSSLNESFATGLTPHNKVLASLVRKRASSDKLPTSPVKKPTTEANSSAHTNENGNSQKNTNGIDADSNNPNIEIRSTREADVDGLSRNGAMKESMFYPSAMKCVGVLPGIGSYFSDDSSDSERTSGSDIDEGLYTLSGQKVEKKAKSS